MELLAPAGNIEKLKWAVKYGADAVYFGTEFGSLRSFAGNFSLDDASEGLKILHKNGKKGYVTLNIYPFSHEHDRMIHIARSLDEMGADAFIVSDIGLLTALGRLGLRASLHVSTQANTINYQSVLAYGELGAKRVNLARELSLEKIQEIQANLEGRVETEVFIHGAVCFSYSGRCAISDYMTGFPANRGECKHPCRWKYFLVEETRPDEYMPVFEDDRGLYLFNSKELALFEYVPALEASEVAAIKIEGRMKSIHYIATVVSFYRQVLDGRIFSAEQGLDLLGRVPNRGYSKGFMKGNIEDSDYQWDHSTSLSESIFVGNITEDDVDHKYAVLEVRNRITGGDELEVLAPDGSLSRLVLPKTLRTIEGREVEYANHTQFILLDKALEPYSILRRVNKGSETKEF